MIPPVRVIATYITSGAPTAETVHGPRIAEPSTVSDLSEVIPKYDRGPTRTVFNEIASAPALRISFTRSDSALSSNAPSIRTLMPCPFTDVRAAKTRSCAS